VALVSRDEQLRLQRLYAGNTVTEFLLGHLDGDDFLYRELTPSDHERVSAQVETWHLASLATRKMGTLSLGEMRIAMIARAALAERRLYLLDEVFSSLSPLIASRVREWMQRLPEESVVLYTGHGDEAARVYISQRRLHVTQGMVRELQAAELTEWTPQAQGRQSTVADVAAPRVLIRCVEADFYHDFARIFEGMSFELKTGDRVLLTGANGSGKTTLLRVMHGDFRPAWQQGTLAFDGNLAHEQRRELWQKVQFAAAAQFNYFPVAMTVRDVLASRMSGSIYSYEIELSGTCGPVLAAFDIDPLLARLFSSLSEGEKTRVLLARAFLMPAPVYLIDEGFMALSARYFAVTQQYLNALPADATVVIAANERITELRRGLRFILAEWRLDHGQLTTLA
jgi:ABC-type molybdenum transport system ATPase subunit/photorepair protein PhrA